MAATIKNVASVINMTGFEESETGFNLTRESASVLAENRWENPLLFFWLSLLTSPAMLTASGDASVIFFSSALELSESVHVALEIGKNWSQCKEWKEREHNKEYNARH